MNNYSGIGRITRDLDLKVTQNNTYFLDFSIAINNGKDEKGNERPADFINCRAWKGRAEAIARYFSKGAKIGISGELKSQSYVDNDGNKKYYTYILVKEFDFCNDRSRDNTTPADVNNEVNNNYAANDDNFSNEPNLDISSDDLPFY